MGKRKGLDIFLFIAAIILFVLAIASFIMALVAGNVFGAIFGLFSAMVTVVLIVRVLLLARDAGDADKTIVDRSDIDNLKDKMK